MNVRSKLIILLLISGLGLYGVVNVIVLPKINANEKQYAIEQQDPLTHDFDRILSYKNQYMGNAANLGMLFDHLPLNDIQRTYQSYPELLTFEIIYQEKILNSNKENVERAFIYNATAAFTLIDNLEGLYFSLDDERYKVSRTSLEQWYGIDLRSLTHKSIWEEKIQNRLVHNNNIKEGITTVFERETY
ncbi:DUF4825 domain-containing protein [Bacillus sp. SCS-151]|uniref:DUF4825 domain-containing protein n=1 Tax=Nanhaiella sioensis TaxID=3115293 RepID=UPI003978B972